MKKVFLLILAFCLMLTLSGCAQSNEFVFKEKIKWGSSLQDVIAVEGSDLKQVEKNGYTWAKKINMPVGKHTGVLNYLFKDDKLQAIFYQVDTPYVPKPGEDIWGDTVTSYETKYGKGTEVEKNILWDFSEILADAFGRTYKVTDKSKGTIEYARGDTKIWLEKSRGIFILYAMPGLFEQAEATAEPEPTAQQDDLSGI